MDNVIGEQFREHSGNIDLGGLAFGSSDFFFPLINFLTSFDLEHVKHVSQSVFVESMGDRFPFSAPIFIAWPKEDRAA